MPAVYTPIAFDDVRLSTANPGYRPPLSLRAKRVDDATYLYPGLKAVLQAGHVKDDPNPDAFLPVPVAYVTGPTWGARLRLLDLCLSVLLWHARTSRSRSTLAFTDGTTVEVGERTFAVS